MKKRVLLVFVLFIACAGCTTPAAEAKVGDTVDFAHFIDAQTGKCIYVYGASKYTYFRVAEDAACVRR